MLIGRDPFIFSIVIEPVKEWNRINDKYDFVFCNGIMQSSERYVPLGIVSIDL